MKTQHFPGFAAGISPARASWSRVCGCSFNSVAACSSVSVCMSHRLFDVQTFPALTLILQNFVNWS
jgi:hypothetical protein